MIAVLAICIGASAGALGRWGLGLWLSPSGALIPWGTLVANLVGGYLPSTLKEISGFVLILVVLMVRPFGLFGEKRIERV